MILEIALAASTVVNIVAVPSLFIAIKRLFQFQTKAQFMHDSVFVLVTYCQKLEKQALISDAPEVIRFHELVKNVARNFASVFEMETEDDNG